MRFSIFATIFTATLAIAAPSPNPSPKNATASPTQGIVDIFHGLETSLVSHSQKLQAAAGSVTWFSPQADKDKAASVVKAELSAMTTAAKNATVQVGSVASGPKLKSRDIVSDLIAIGSAIVNIVFASINIALSFPNSVQPAFALVQGIIALVQASIMAFKDLAPILQPLLNMLLNVASSMPSS